MNIVITGVSRGIGKELVKLFCKNQKNKVIGLSRNFMSMMEFKKENNYNNFIPYQFDLENADSFNTLQSKIKEECNEIDILINNAGFLINKPFEEFTYEEQTKIFKINVIGTGELIKQLIPLLKKETISHVVNISSMGGFQGSSKFPGLSYYSASKAAIASLTECLAEEYKETNIKFNCLALGAVNTEMLAEAFPGYEAPHKAFEMAEFMYDFALNGHKYYNGKILPVSVSTP